MGKSLSVSQALSIRRSTLRLEGGWGNCVGEIDRTGVVFFWGKSGNGKTSAVLSFGKELARFGRVLYNSLEEGLSVSFLNALRRHAMQDCGRRFQVVAGESIADLDERLSKRKSPDFVIIDSFQYTQLDYRQYIAFKERHLDKMLVFVSHADGKQPAGRVRCRAEDMGRGIQSLYERTLLWANGRIYDLARKSRGILGRPQQTETIFKERKIMKIYISGRISGRPLAQVREEFEQAEIKLRRFGFLPINPMNNGLPADAAWEDHMGRDIAMLLRCQAIYMLPGWPRSEGATLEYLIARQRRMRIFTAESPLVKTVERTL